MVLYVIRWHLPQIEIVNQQHAWGHSSRKAFRASTGSCAQSRRKGVLLVIFSFFNIIYQPLQLFDKCFMEDVIFACCLLHDIIGEVRKESYTGTRNTRVIDFKDFIGQVSDGNLITEPEDLREASLFWMSRLNEDKSPLLHKNIKDVLATAMWNTKGDETDLS
jgi:hypothetical protein